MVAVKLSGGAKLEAYLRAISHKVNQAASVDVGFMGGGTYPDGTGIAEVAAFNEFGVPSHNQPPRPFFRLAIKNNNHKWGPNLARALQNSDFDAASSLELLGQEIEGEIRDSINELSTPPLAASTVARKGFPKPLIDTGTMLNSVTHLVKEK